MKKYASMILGYTLLGSFILILDRLTKLCALNLEYEKVITPFLSFDLAFNRGISWGLLQEAHAQISTLVSVIIFAIIISLAIYAGMRLKAGYGIIGETMVLAGAISNWYDRLYYPGVIDFILVHWHDWLFPSFNIADAAIVCGVGVMLLMHHKRS